MHGAPKGLAFAIYYPFLAVVGIPASLVAIAILSRGRCGLSRCITRYLVVMAMADLLVIITGLIFNRIVGIYFPVSFLSITPLCSLRPVLNSATFGTSAWLTFAFTFDRFVAICCQKQEIKYCTEKTATYVIRTVCTVNCFKSSFLHFIYEPLYISNNTPWFCSVKNYFYTSPAWAAYDLILHILKPCLAFILILPLNSQTIRRIREASRARRRLRTQSDGENQSDPEMENRRRSIVFLFCISGSFILLWIWFLINCLYVRIARVTYFSGSDFNRLNFILEEIGIMLQLLSSCITPFICAGTQSKFREDLKNALKFPWILIVKFIQQ